MARHGSRRADLVPKQDGGKAHARGNGNHDESIRKCGVLAPMEAIGVKLGG